MAPREESQRSQSRPKVLGRGIEDPGLKRSSLLASSGHWLAARSPSRRAGLEHLRRTGHASFYFFETVVRELKHDVFAYEFPRSVVERGCIAYMPSDRFGRLPGPLRQFLLENFQPYDEDLWFWGRRWEVSGELEAKFQAVRDGSYFVWPPQVATRGELVVGGQRVVTPVLPLAAGMYDVRYRGEEGELYLVWLPADGRPFGPRPEVKAGLGGS